MASLKKARPRTRRLDYKLHSKQDVTEVSARNPSGRGHRMAKPHRDWEVDGIYVSDHAVVRYLELCCGMDMRQVRRAMIAGGRGDLIRNARSCKIPINGGAKLITRNGLVVTVVKRRKGVPE